MTDPDGGAHPASPKVYPSDGVSRVSWVWYWLADDAVTETVTVVQAVDTAIAAHDDGDGEGPNPVVGMAATYTPSVDDDGRVLVARATYFDRTYDDTVSDDDPDTDPDTFSNMATSAPTVPVRDAPSKQPARFQGLG